VTVALPHSVGVPFQLFGNPGWASGDLAAARVGAAAGEAYQAAYDPQLAFEFGLARVLDGIAVLIGRRA